MSSEHLKARAGKTSPVVVVLVGVVLVAAAGTAYYLTRSDDERRTLDSTAEKAGLQAEVQVTRQRIAMYKAFVKACEDAKKGLKTDVPSYSGHDAFSYSDEAKYRTELSSQEARMDDLQKRLGSAFDR